MHYEFSRADGTICCSTDNAADLCDACKAALRDAEALDPYASAIAARRAACPDVQRQLAAHADDDEKLASMAAFRGVMLAQRLTTLCGLSPATGDAYTNPPDGYQLAVERRRSEAR